MGVYSRLLTGFTVEVAQNLKHADFRKADAFVKKHPELDEYACSLYNEKEAIGRLILIVDGMNGKYARLVYLDKCLNYAHSSTGSEMQEIVHSDPPDELYLKFKELYEEYTGDEFTPDKIKYAMWTQWH